MQRRKLLSGAGIAIFGALTTSQSANKSSSLLLTAQSALAEGERMKLMTEFRLSASYYQFFIHDRDAEYCPDSFYSEPDDHRSDIGSSKQGYLTNGRTICFGTDAHLNVYWAEVYLANRTPDFGKAERVIALPLQVNSGRIVITTLFSEPDPKREVAVSPGTWTVYLLAFNLGSDELYDQRVPRPERLSDTNLSDEQLRANWEFERYKIILVPGFQTPIGVLHGTATVRGV